MSGEEEGFGGLSRGRGAGGPSAWAGKMQLRGAETEDLQRGRLLQKKKREKERKERRKKEGGGRNGPGPCARKK